MAGSPACEGVSYSSSASKWYEGQTVLVLSSGKLTGLSSRLPGMKVSYGAIAPNGVL